MRILFNAPNKMSGGGLQVAVSLLGEFKEICVANGDELFVLASETFEKYARELGIKHELFKRPPSSFKHY